MSEMVSSFHMEQKKAKLPTVLLHFSAHRSFSALARMHIQNIIVRDAFSFLLVSGIVCSKFQVSFAVIVVDQFNLRAAGEEVLKGCSRFCH